MADIQTQKVEPMVPEWAMDMPAPGKKPKADYPRINLDLRALPIAGEWPVGKRYRLVIVGTLTAMRNDQGKGDFTLEVEEAGGAAEAGAAPRESRKAARTPATSTSEPAAAAPGY